MILSSDLLQLDGSSVPPWRCDIARVGLVVWASGPWPDQQPGKLMANIDFESFKVQAMFSASS